MANSFLANTALHKQTEGKQLLCKFFVGLFMVLFVILPLSVSKELLCFGILVLISSL